MTSAPHSATAARYLDFLRQAYTTDDGRVRTPAKGKYVDQLKALEAGPMLRYDLSRCLAGDEPDFCGRVWFWSDLHFFHTNVIRYTNRPFADAAAMNEAMVRNCLDLVGPEDILVFGGDLTMGNVTATNQLLRAMPGFHVNVLGNHDIDQKGKMLALEVDAVVPYLELDFAGQSIFVTHYPLAEHRMDLGQLNLHGHIHNTPLHPSLGSGARHLNMSVEHTGYKPVSLEWLLAQAVR